MSLVTAVAITLNIFHLPLYFHGIEIERLELGLVVILLMVNRIKLQNLIITIVVLTIVDQLQHGHSLITVPIEIVFNTIILIIFYLFMRLIKYKTISGKLIIFVGCLICIIAIKAVYLATILYIFVPEINLFNLQNVNHEELVKNSSIIIMFSLLVIVKFSIILSIAIRFNGKLVK